MPNRPVDNLWTNRSDRWGSRAQTVARPVDAPVDDAPGRRLLTAASRAPFLSTACGPEKVSAAVYDVDLCDRHPDPGRRRGDRRGRTTGRSSGSRCPPSAPWWPSRCSCSPTRPSSGTSAPRSWPGWAWPAPLLATAVSVCVFLAYGTTAVGRPPGRRRRPAGRHRAGRRRHLAGARASASCWPRAGGCARPLVDAFGTSAAATPYALTYLRVSVVGLPAMLVVLAATGVLRGLQDTRTPLVGRRGRRGGQRRAQPRPGLRRRAWASPAPRSARCSPRPAWRRRSSSSWSAAPAARARRCGRTCPASGPPAAPASRSSSGPLTLRAALLLDDLRRRRTGTVAVAAHQVAFTIWLFLSLMLDAVAIAGQAIVGRYLGAVRRRRHPGGHPPDGRVGRRSGVAARGRPARGAGRLRAAVHRGPGGARAARRGARRGRRGPAGVRRRVRPGRRAHRGRRRPLPRAGPA